MAPAARGSRSRAPSELMTIREPTEATPPIAGAAVHANSLLLPVCLVLIRAELALALVVLVHFAPRPSLYGVFVLWSLFTDVVLRRYGGRPERGMAGVWRMHEAIRRVFHVAAVYAVWALHPAELPAGAVAIALTCAFAAARRGVEVHRFGRPLHYRTWASEIWNLALGLTLLGTLACGADAVIVTVALAVGVLVQVEKVTISLVLTHRPDAVNSIFHAMHMPS